MSKLIGFGLINTLLVKKMAHSQSVEMQYQGKLESPSTQLKTTLVWSSGYKLVFLSFVGAFLSDLHGA